MPNDRSIARSTVKNEIGRDQHGGSRHILNDSGWFAGNVLREVARDQPGVRIITSAGGSADDELDCFALVELLDGGSSSRRDQRSRDEDGKQKYAECFGHELPPGSLAVWPEAKLPAGSMSSVQRSRKKAVAR